MPESKTVTVKEAVPRANADGYYVTEYALRHWIRIGAIPVRKVGQKQLIYYEVIHESKALYKAILSDPSTKSGKRVTCYFGASQVQTISA